MMNRQMNNPFKMGMRMCGKPKPMEGEGVHRVRDWCPCGKTYQTCNDCMPNPSSTPKPEPIKTKPTPKPEMSIMPVGMHGMGMDGMGMHGMGMHGMGDDDEDEDEYKLSNSDLLKLNLLEEKVLSTKKTKKKGKTGKKGKGLTLSGNGGDISYDKATSTIMKGIQEVKNSLGITLDKSKVQKTISEELKKYNDAKDASKAVGKIIVSKILPSYFKKHATADKAREVYKNIQTNEAIKKLQDHTGKLVYKALKSVHKTGNGMKGSGFWKDFAKGFVKGFSITGKILSPIVSTVAPEVGAPLAVVSNLVGNIKV